MNDEHRSPANPPPAHVSVRSLFRGAAGETFDERLRLMASSDPADWDGVAFPTEVAIELAALCNLACVMCPVPTTKRPPELMKEKLFLETVDQLATEKGYVLLPQGFGESMLHPKWAGLIAAARERGIGPIIMLTNGMLLNEKNVSRVLELDVDALVVSIDGTTAATYASVRVGGDLDVVERNVELFLARRGARSSPKLVVRIIRMQDTANEIDAFFERWTPRLQGGDEIRINEYNNWSGRVEDRAAAGAAAPDVAHRAPCRMLWSNLSVHADGKVSACCHDSEDELVVGDLAAGDTLQSIWRGEKLRALRTIHREGRTAELPICRDCRNWT